MLGAIAGDIIGSVHEFERTKTTSFDLFVADSMFTDDTVLAVAVAECLLDGGDYVDAFHRYFGWYPNAGYGGRFYHWASARERQPYNSWGNGSAMRVPAVGYAFDSMDDVLAESERSAAVTHNHPEGVKGAQATAAAVLLARQGESKQAIKRTIERMLSYDLGTTVDRLRPTYHFDESCQGTVPAALVAFLDSTDYEDAVRKSISLGGDADTLACITGAVAEAHYGSVPPAIEAEALGRLDGRLLDVVTRFRTRYPPRQ